MKISNKKLDRSPSKSTNSMIIQAIPLIIMTVCVLQVFFSSFNMNSSAAVTWNLSNIKGTTVVETLSKSLGYWEATTGKVFSILNLMVEGKEVVVTDRSVNERIYNLAVPKKITHIVLSDTQRKYFNNIKVDSTFKIRVNDETITYKWYLEDNWANSNKFYFIFDEKGNISIFSENTFEKEIDRE